MIIDEINDEKVDDEKIDDEEIDDDIDCDIVDDDNRMPEIMNKGDNKISSEI